MRGSAIQIKTRRIIAEVRKSIGCDYIIHIDIESLPAQLRLCGLLIWSCSSVGKSAYEVTGSIPVTATSLLNLKNQRLMRKSIYQLIREQKTDWREFAEIVGFKNTLQQIAVGAAMGIILLAILGIGEWISRLIFE